MRRVVYAWLALAVTTAASAAAPARERTAIAIIVNGDNDVQDQSLDDLRAAFMLERQFWPDGHRIVLFLPPPESAARTMLLDRLYGMSDFELRKHWVGELFRGAIPSIPSTLPGTEALTAAVAGSAGGLSAVPADAVPRGVRVLRIGGRAPDDPAYPLAAGR
jgi:hypothetical protein